MTKDEAAQVMTIMAEHFGEPLDQKMISAWYNCTLEPLPLELATRLARAIIILWDEFPTAVKFKALGRLVEPPEPAREFVTEADWKQNHELASQQIWAMRAKLQNSG